MMTLSLPRVVAVALLPCLGLPACGSSDESTPWNGKPVDGGTDAADASAEASDATSDSVPDAASPDVDGSTPVEGGTLDLCGNGLDDDGNGEIDEGCACEEGANQACFPGDPALAGKGICAMGTQVCEKKTSGEFTKTEWAACQGAGAPAAEACNGVDDDCDGTPDDGCPCVEGEEKACSTACGDGKQKCTASAWGECSAKQPEAETCNGLDDDCDGTPDDAAPCPPGKKCAGGACVDDCTPVAGGWSDWTCSTCDPCVSLTKTCTRTCTNPAPSCGGAACVGESSTSQDCGANASQPLSFSGTQTFSSCHEIRAGQVPAGVTQLTFALWGGGGGGGAPGKGGGGAYLKATLPVAQGDNIELRVACGGAPEGGGGGASYVYRNGALVMVAAGGGGGGSDGSGGGSVSWNVNAGRGGGGGAVGGVGEAGFENNNHNCGSGGGQGATQTAGGAAGVAVDNCTQYTGCSINGVAGASDQGGANGGINCSAGKSASNAWGGCSSCANGCGGGGGSGYFGGGSGAGKYTYTGGGGGGGSSWISPQVSLVSSEAGVVDVPGGTSASGYNSTAGRGGNGETNSQQNAASGGNGLVIMTPG